ncbi:MAG: hypothetical protein F6K11_10210 [Leptolyngbya sp. SIO3F4]|nr:hypothetical protein [Leptolyngbya sp. SIO3F4]
MIPSKITFRLNGTEAKTLYYAAREKGISPHLLARDIVIQGVDVAKLEESLQFLAQTLEEIRMAQIKVEQSSKALRDGVIEALCTQVSKDRCMTESSAREWLRAKFQTKDDFR